MNSKERREDIIITLKGNDTPIKGSVLSEKYGVTRQVIVKDIAILRAKDNNIIATPEGYIISKDNRIRAIIAVNHLDSEKMDEMSTIIRYGGIVEDVIIEHPLYGEIKGNLMIKTLNDLEKFIKESSKSEAMPLSKLTKGFHLHTISTNTLEEMELIKKSLKEKGFLV